MPPITPKGIKMTPKLEALIWGATALIVAAALIIIITVQYSRQKPPPPPISNPPWSQPGISINVRKAQRYCCTPSQSSDPSSSSSPGCSLTPGSIDVCATDIYSAGTSIVDCNAVIGDCSIRGINKCTKCTSGEGNCIDPDTLQCSWATSAATDSNCMGNSVICS